MFYIFANLKLMIMSANILPVNMLYVKTVSILMHDTSSGSVPPNIAKLVTRSRDIHS